MRKNIYLLGLVLVAAMALAASQTGSPSSSSNQSPPPKQPNPAGNDQRPSAATQTGSLAGANANGDSGTSPATSTSESRTDQAEDGPSASELQAQIQNALKNEPTLIHDKVNVSVLENQIDLSGSVATTKEKLTAQRIVQSYAENRKVNDRLTVSGHKPDHGTNATPDAVNPTSNPEKSNPPLGH